MDSPLLRIVPLGGLGEIGKNMMAVEYAGHVIIIDAGIMFPAWDMPGVDFIIPDFKYLLQPGLTVEAILITHGHEDHIGAIAHIVSAFPAPIYATPFTCALLESKLRGARSRDNLVLNRINAGDVLTIAPFSIEPFHVCHSIPDCVGFGIQTPLGLIVHTGDFKFDQTPIDHRPTDYARLSSFADRSPLLLLSDSTNADRPGWTPSERVIDGAFDNAFREAPGRIIIATFASLIARVQQAAEAAARHGRKLAITGHSMSDNIRLATQLGYLTIPPGVLISLDEAAKLPANEVVYMATGTQGEPSAVLNRLAHARYHKLALQPGDTVILSAHPIPGNEEAVNRIINRLMQRGAHVIYDAISPVHVSGHASQEEQKLMISLVRPRYFIPVHGELRHLRLHAGLAESVGVPPENIAVIENGMVIEFDQTGHMRMGARFPGGYVFVDGSTVGTLNFEVLREREHLSRDGFIVATVAIQRREGRIGQPEFVTRGVMLRDEAPGIFDELAETVRAILAGCLESDPDGALPLAELSATVQRHLEKAIQATLRRRPQVYVVIHELTPGQD